MRISKYDLSSHDDRYEGVALPMVGQCFSKELSYSKE